MSDQNTSPASAGGINAKGSSLWAQIVAALWIAGWSAVKFMANPADIDSADILLSGAGIAACFTPVYFSIIMDKIKDIRVGKSAGGEK